MYITSNHALKICKSLRVMTEWIFNQSVCRVPEKHILMRLAIPLPPSRRPTAHRTSDSDGWKGPCPKWAVPKSWDHQVSMGRMGFNTNMLIHDLDDLERPILWKPHVEIRWMSCNTYNPTQGDMIEHVIDLWKLLLLLLLSFYLQVVNKDTLFTTRLHFHPHHPLSNRWAPPPLSLPQQLYHPQSIGDCDQEHQWPTCLNGPLEGKIGCCQTASLYIFETPDKLDVSTSTLI